MKPNHTFRAALAVALLGLAAPALAQVPADKLGKSTSGIPPAAVPVTPGGPGAFDEAGYGRYWKSMDANADGRVSRDEYLAYYGGRWDKSDLEKRGYHDQKSLRTLYVEREMSKTDGHPAGSPINPTTKK